MLLKGMTKSEIESEVSKSGDYVKIDNLTRFLKTNSDLPIEIKKFIYQKLAEIYGTRNMFFDSALSYQKNAELCVLHDEKIKNLLKSVEGHIKGNCLDDAERIAIRCLQEATNSKEKIEIRKNLKEFYLKEAERSFKEKRRSSTIKIYERMLEMQSVSVQEKTEIKDKLLKLYLMLGMIVQYNRMKDKVFKEEKRLSEKDKVPEGLEFLYE